MTTLNERSKSVLGRIINKEQAGLELQAANRMNSFLLNVDRLVGELASLRDCRSYLVGEGLDVGVPTGKRSQDASKARTNLRSAATRLEKSDLNAQELISAVDGDAARQAVDLGNLRDCPELLEHVSIPNAKGLTPKRSTTTSLMFPAIPDSSTAWSRQRQNSLVQSRWRWGTSAMDPTRYEIGLPCSKRKPKSGAPGIRNS